MAKPIIPIYPIFAALTSFTPVIPKMYWEVVSQEQLIHNIMDVLNQVCAYAHKLGLDLNATQEDVENLAKEFENFKNGAYDDFYKEVIEKWVTDNMTQIIEQAIKMVFFGLSDDGYFVAYIPESWSDIDFETGYDYDDKDTYMHLILKY